MTDELIIFDCDGVLVDSEPLSIRLLRDMLGEQGCHISEVDAYLAFLGKSISTITQSVFENFQQKVNDINLYEFNERLFRQYRESLTPIDGVTAAIDKIDKLRCVASSSDPRRIAYSLALTGLSNKFTENVYSATMVSKGKPAPDLFLHAAAELGVAPSECVVIEDSVAGITAAKAAGMKCIAFAGGSHYSQVKSLSDQLFAMKPDAFITHMNQLPIALEEL